MNDRLTPPRRRILAALAGVPLLSLTLTGCTGTPPGKRTLRGAGEEADARVRWHAARTEQNLLVLHAATIARHSELEDAVEPFSSHHRQHVDALVGDGPLPLLARLDVIGSADTGGDVLGRLERLDAELPEVPDDPGQALTAVRAAELAASEAHLTDCLEASSPRLAALLASVAAAEAAHDAGLGAR
ncbi:hypothetical protein G1H11_24700 [Phytoactinopolyspora alkaliphila]|uniref:DUF305 domain-containing protein n=1 Tax=Phytoactinopolyspora alkaliphila TaxID=1783498 RepID=A0A6N9YU40_9ACTN|nr:hypothetical protein [Phytoactinopolyspora alkaliphila]NED98502.1 hypothetical protein [Phytoactinopolyspora alkaliphila]